MFFSPIFISHGIIALREELVRQKNVHEKYPDDWPEGFDANDIPLFEIILNDFQRHESVGYEEMRLHSKPLIFFFRLIPDYVRDHGASLSEAERIELITMFTEFCARVPHARLPPSHGPFESKQ